MVTAKARIMVHDGYESFVPIVIPDLDDVRRFAHELHAGGIAGLAMPSVGPWNITPSGRSRPWIPI